VQGGDGKKTPNWGEPRQTKGQKTKKKPAPNRCTRGGLTPGSEFKGNGIKDKVRIGLMVGKKDRVPPNTEKNDA